jgi:hypothetical protein
MGYEEAAIERRRLGRTLILLGVLAWAPYALLRYGLGLEVPLWAFLTAHLLGVIPGSILSRWHQIARLLGRGDETRAPGAGGTEPGARGSGSTRRPFGP